MGELGEYGNEAHRDAGALAAQLGIDRLFAVGTHAGEVVSAARAAGMDASSLHAGRDWEETAAARARGARAGRPRAREGIALDAHGADRRARCASGAGAGEDV